jgi:hypothetical protein
MKITGEEINPTYIITFEHSLFKTEQVETLITTKNNQLIVFINLKNLAQLFLYS